MAHEYRLPFTAREIIDKLNKVDRLSEGGGTGGGSTGGGVSSWNDLSDKPFYEEVTSLGDTITWDGVHNDNTIVLEIGGGDYMAFHYMYDVVLTTEQLIGGTIVADVSGQAYADEITEDIIQQQGAMYMIGGQTGGIAMATEDNVDVGMGVTLPKRGVYFIVISMDGMFVATKSLTIQNYDFIGTVVHTIDPKYLPTNIYGTSGIVTLDATNWDATTLTYTLAVEDLGGKDAILLSPVTIADKSTLEMAEIFVSAAEHTVTLTAATVPTTDIQLNYFIVRGA